MHKLVCGGKNYIAGFTIALFLTTAGWPAHASNSRVCADISKDKIAETLKKLNIPAAEILGSRQSPLEGICEIEFTSKGSPGVFYTDRDLNYLISGSMFDTRKMVNLTAVGVQRLQDRKRIDLAKITLNEGLTVGVKGATKKVIILTDPD